MKRRDFLQSAGAAAVVPVMPLPAVAAPIAAAPANTAQVGWATLFARANNRATPALIQTWLGVGPEQAQALMSELVSRKVVHGPIAGQALAVKPMYPGGRLDSRCHSARKTLQKAKEVFEAFVDEPEVLEVHEVSDEAS